MTGSIGIAWSLKPLWAAFLDMFATKKFFVLAMELAIAGLLAATAFALKLPNYFTVIAGILWLIAFASATQDICVDGIYITALDKKRQAAWMGTQSGCWNLGRMFGTSLIVGLASVFIGHGTDARTGWTYALLIAAADHGRDRRLSLLRSADGKPGAKAPQRARGRRHVRRGGEGVFPEEVDLGDAHLRFPLPQR